MDDTNSSAGRGAGKPGADALLKGIAQTASILRRGRRRRITDSNPPKPPKK